MNIPWSRRGCFLWIALLAVCALLLALTGCADSTGRIIGKSMVTNYAGQPRYYVTIKLTNGNAHEEEVKPGCYFAHDVGDCVVIDGDTGECSDAECE